MKGPLKLNPCYELAQTLSKNEWFQFVRDAATMQHAGTRRLIQLLRPHYPDFSITDPEILAHPDFMPGQSLAQLRVLRANVKSHLEEFLLQSYLDRHTDRRQSILTAALIERNALGPAHKVVERCARNAPDIPLNMDDLEFAYQLEAHRLDLYTRYGQRGKLYDWPKLFHRFSVYALTQRLQLLAAWKAQFSVQSDPDPDLEQHARIAFAETERFGPEASPLLSIGYHLLAMQFGMDFRQHDAAIAQTIARHGGAFDRIDLINILGLKVNVLTVAASKRQEGAARALFETYRYMVAHDLVFGLGTFSINITRNILATGVRLGELDWTEQFLEMARQRLPEEEAEKFIPFGRAWLQFGRGEYAETRRALQKATYGDPFYSISQRLLALRTYYKLEESDLFSAELNALTRQLYRDRRVSPEYSRKRIQYCNALGKMQTHRQNPNAGGDQLRRIRKKVENDNPPYADWLIGEIDLLERDASGKYRN